MRADYAPAVRKAPPHLRLAPLHSPTRIAEKRCDNSDIFAERQYLRAVQAAPAERALRRAPAPDLLYALLTVSGSKAQNPWVVPEHCVEDSGVARDQRGFVRPERAEDGLAGRALGRGGRRLGLRRKMSLTARIFKPAHATIIGREAR